MVAYRLFHPDTEIIGQVILDFEQAIGSKSFLAIFEKHGLGRVEAAKWYPAQDWLDALNEISQSDTGVMDIVSIGITQLELATMPEVFDELPLSGIFVSLEDAYRMNYRGTDIGNISSQVISDKHVKMFVRSFEPDDLWYGNLYGCLRRYYKGSGSYFVKYDTEHPSEDNVTVFDVWWD